MPLSLTPPPSLLNLAVERVDEGVDGGSGAGSSHPSTWFQRLGYALNSLLGALNARSPALAMLRTAQGRSTRLIAHVCEHGVLELVGGSFEFGEPASQRLRNVREFLRSHHDQSNDQNDKELLYA